MDISAEEPSDAAFPRISRRKRAKDQKRTFPPRLRHFGRLAALEHHIAFHRLMNPQNNRAEDWQVIYEKGVTKPILEVIPPTAFDALQWRSKWDRALEVFGVGGMLMQLMDTHPDLQEAVNSGSLKAVFVEVGKQVAEPQVSSEWARRWEQTLLEAMLFLRNGWRIRRCNHGQHWFIADYRRREDCPAHRAAGSKARSRKPLQA